MKPIDDPKFAAAVRLFEQEHAARRQYLEAKGRAVSLHMQGNAAKPSPQTHYRTMAKLREQVFARLDSRRSTL